MRSELTEIERQIAYSGRLDLGAGYPIGLAPDWVWSLEPCGRSSLVPGQLEEAAQFALALPSSQASLLSTFTGSIALQRAMIAANNLQSENFSSVRVLTTDPCIDIILGMAREITGTSAVRVKIGLQSKFSDKDCSAVCSEIESLSDESVGLIVVITSPENPTGAYWSRSQLKEIAEKCKFTNSILIVDHCFLMAGIHGESDVCAIWDVVDLDASIIGIWDTGKILHLDGSKVGFLIAKNATIVRELEDALSIIQFGVADYTSTWFSRILIDPRFPDLIRDLRRVSRQNQALLRSWAQSQEISIHNAEGGAFEVIKLGNSRGGNVGTVPFSVFTSESFEANGWQRVALARQTDVFAQFLRQLGQDGKT